MKPKGICSNPFTYSCLWLPMAASESKTKETICVCWSNPRGGGLPRMGVKQAVKKKGKHCIIAGFANHTGPFMCTSLDFPNRNVPISVGKTLQVPQRRRSSTSLRAWSPSSSLGDAVQPDVFFFFGTNRRGGFVGGCRGMCEKWTNEESAKYPLVRRPACPPTTRPPPKI